MTTATPNIQVRPSTSELYNKLRADGHFTNMTLEDFAREMNGYTRKVLADDNRGNARTLAVSKEIDFELTADCAKRGVSLTAALNELDPTDNERDMALGIDAFSRQVANLQAPNGEYISTYSSQAEGVQSSLMTDLWDAGPVVASAPVPNYRLGRLLIHELARRAYYQGHATGTNGFANRLFYGSSQPVSAVLNPSFVIGALTEVAPLHAPILNQLIAVTTTVPRGAFSYAVFVDDPANTHKRRTPEGAPLPIFRLSVVDRTGQVYKYGARLQITYEALRRMTIDLFRFHLARIGQQNALDKETVAIETLAAGDTNANTQPDEYDTTTIGGTAGQSDLAAVLNIMAIFEATGMYIPRVAIAQRATAIALRMTSYGSVEAPAFLGTNTLVGGGQMGEGIQAHPPIYARAAAPTGKVMYVDTTKALGLAIEAGSDLTETDRNIANQYEEVAISEVMSFYINDQNATILHDTAN